MPDDIGVFETEVTTVLDMLLSDYQRTGFRAGGNSASVHQSLGLLAELPGMWRGKGFNLIGRPFFKAKPPQPPFFLELNATRETLDVTAISGAIPNRGSGQPDINLHGVRYVQQVIDADLDSGIHIETGMWIRVPPTTDPASTDETYVRQSTIPHGDSLLAQSIFTTTVAGGPLLNPVDTTPFTDAVIPGLNESPKNPVSNEKGYLNQYLNDPLPNGMAAGLDAAAVIKNPVLLLQSAIAGQRIDSTVVISVSTAGSGNLINIPFVQRNANATQLDAIFWIEIVEREDGETFMQLQYVQRVILDFIGIKWPHVSVATLKKL